MQNPSESRLPSILQVSATRDDQRHLQKKFFFSAGRLLKRIQSVSYNRQRCRGVNGVGFTTLIA